MKDCFGLHGHYAFGSVANKKSGVGRKSATSVGLTTDLVHWLQAGKTVAVVRFASRSTDLLPPSALPRSLRSLRLFPPARPSAGRLPAAAGHRAAVVVLRIHRGNSADSVGCHQSERRWVLSCLTAIGVSIPYLKTRERYPSIYSIGAIEDLETFDYSPLRGNFGPTSAAGSARPSLSSTHYGLQR